jgi:general secretion pathway protein D
MISSQVGLTGNVINQPVFSTRKVTTNVSVWDGQTVVLGGLMREDVQKTEDKTPIIGDIPLVGRLFRTNVDQHIKPQPDHIRDCAPGHAGRDAVEC